MKSKTLISLAVIILVLIGLTAWSRQNSTPDSNQGNAELTAAETTFDFGVIKINGGLVQHNFLIKNNGAAAVTIREIYTSCMCTTALWTGPNGSAGPFGMPGHGALPTVSETLAPNEEATVAVTFDPAAHGPSGIGRVERLVYIKSADAKSLTLKIYAQVTP